MRLAHCQHQCASKTFILQKINRQVMKTPKIKGAEITVDRFVLVPNLFWEGRRVAVPNNKFLKVKLAGRQWPIILKSG
jgi:hypothetical protein